MRRVFTRNLPVSFRFARSSFLNATNQHYYYRKYSSSAQKPKVDWESFKHKALEDLKTKPQIAPSYLRNVAPTEITTLPNNFRIASEYRHGETATVGVWIDTGSCWENDQTNGVAHFLEHMAFKGTKNRTQQQIEIEIENMGGSLNAYTSREQTVYYAHVFKKDVPKAVEILSDILQNSTFAEQHIERERGVILREMEEVESQTEEVVFDHLHSLAYQGTPLGYTILGPEKNIKSIKRDDLTNYIETHYTGPRMVLAAAGAVEHSQLCDLANKHFGNLSSKSNAEPSSFQEWTGSAVNVRNDSMPLVHSAIAVQGVSWASPLYYSFQLLQSLIGSWDRSLGGGKNLSSRAVETLAKERLAHSMMTFNTCYHNTGIFGGYLVTEPSKSAFAIEIMLNEWTRIGYQTTPTEVERAKNKLQASSLMVLDGTSSVCEDIGRQMLTLGRRITPFENYLRIQALNYEHIRDTATKYLSDKEPAVAAIGPIDAGQFPDLHQIRAWTLTQRT